MRNVPQKGDHGYTDAHKKAQIIKTFIFFLLPAVIFTVGYVTSGTRLNLFTVVAVVGCLPDRHTGGMEHAYELVLTTYEKN